MQNGEEFQTDLLVEKNNISIFSQVIFTRNIDWNCMLAIVRFTKDER